MVRTQALFVASPGSICSPPPPSYMIGINFQPLQPAPEPPRNQFSRPVSLFVVENFI